MKYAPQGVRLRVCTGRSLRKEAEAMPDMNELNETEEKRVPAEAGVPAPDSVILSEAKDPTPQDEAPAEGGAHSDEGAVEDGLPSETEGGNAPTDASDSRLRHNVDAEGEPSLSLPPSSSASPQMPPPTSEGGNTDALREEGGANEARPPRAV
ncbi:MAG: hypothetical protein IJU94_05945, partial [Clostridia bacterium]|nr:hypothetical protein [Clostridia bacterium]